MALLGNDKKKAKQQEEEDERRRRRSRKALPPTTPDSAPRRSRKAASTRNLHRNNENAPPSRGGGLLAKVSAIMGPGHNLKKTKSVPAIQASGRQRDGSSGAAGQPVPPTTTTTRKQEKKEASSRGLRVPPPPPPPTSAPNTVAAAQLSQPKTSKNAAARFKTPPPAKPPATRVAPPRGTSGPASGAPAVTRPAPRRAAAATSAPADDAPVRQTLPGATRVKRRPRTTTGPVEEAKEETHKKSHSKPPLKKKPSKPPKLSLSRQRDIQNEMAKRKAERNRRNKVDAEHVDDDNIENIGWFSMTVKENSCASLTIPKENKKEDDAAGIKKKSKKKTKRELRSTVDYSYGNYNFNTQQLMEDKPRGYYLKMLQVKRREFHIENLFTDRPLLPRVYHFDYETLWTCMDKREDKWFIKTRLESYNTEAENTSESDDDESENGMEALSVFFGPNQIDHNPEDGGDDNSIIFSIASVESVHFSDDDDNHDQYNGKPREKVEVMPGDFTILRKEEETHEAIATGNYMPSLCVGCGISLVVVKDALQVACPSCGSITPLNGISLTKPFGIATGVKRVLVEHKLAPRKSPFSATTEEEGPQDVPETVVVTSSIDGNAVARLPSGQERNMKIAARGATKPRAAHVKPSSTLGKTKPSSTAGKRAAGKGGKMTASKSKPTNNTPVAKPGAVRVSSKTRQTN